MTLGKYSKFIIALVGFAVIAATAFFGTNPPSWFQPLVAFLTSIGVYQISNK